MTIEAPLRGIVIRSSCMNPTSRTATLRISKGLVAVSSVGGVALQAIIHAANLDDRWRLFKLHDSSFFPGLVVRID